MPKEIVEALVKGGKATPAPPLGPSLSPLKLNIGDVINKINEKTKSFDGMEVPVKIIVDTGTKTFEIVVGTPPVSAMLKKELRKDKLTVVKEGVRTEAGDLTLGSIIKIARSKDSLSGDLKARTKQVLGTCLSGGVTVDGRSPRDIIKEINEGRIIIE